MTALVTADLHLTDAPRDAYRHQFMRETLPTLAKDRRVQQVIILGDLTEQKDRHAAGLVNAIVGYIAALARIVSEMRGEVIIERGNHDYLDVDSPFYEFVKHMPNVRWINTPMRLSLRGVGQCLFLPHTSDYKRDWHGVSMLDHHYIFAHNTFQGAFGDNRRQLKGIPPEVFPDHAVVIAGDVHSRQQVGPVTYVGAPYTIDFGDDYKPRVMLLDGDEVKSIRVNGPQKRLIELGTDPERWRLGNAAAGDIAKIRVALSRKAADQWGDVRAAVKQWGEKQGLHVHSVEPALIDRVRLADAVAERRRRYSDADLLGMYGRAANVSDRLLSLGRKLMEQA